MVSIRHNCTGDEVRGLIFQKLLFLIALFKVVVASLFHSMTKSCEFLNHILMKNPMFISTTVLIPLRNTVVNPLMRKGMVF